MRSKPTIPIQPWAPTPAAPSFSIVESKLTPAPTRPGLVSRGRLLDWLEASAATPVVAICAPAGYGKTVLAAEWAKRDPRPFVWLSIDPNDNDPAVLLTYLAVGLDRVEPSDPGVLGVLASWTRWRCWSTTCPRDRSWCCSAGGSRHCRWRAGGPRAAWPSWARLIWR